MSEPANPVVSRPPVPAGLPEPPPIIEPALRGMHPPPVAEIADWEPFGGERSVTRTAEDTLAAAREGAFSDDRTRTLLSGSRVVVLGASELRDAKTDGPPRVVLVAYDYERSRAVEVELDAADEGLTVRDVSESENQPSPSDEENERAISIASEHAERHLDPSWAVNTLLTSGVSRGDRSFGERILVVVFGPPDERLPRVRCLVDLGRERVVSMDVRTTKEAES